MPEKLHRSRSVKPFDALSPLAGHSEALLRRDAWILTLAATATMAVSYVDRQAFAVLAPTITRALALDERGYSWLASGFSIAYLVGAPLAGRFIDRVGARRGLVSSVLVWSAIAAAHAMAPGFRGLLFLRVMLGVAESPSFPAAAQTVSRALPERDRNAAFGILFTGSSFGAMVAPPLVTLLEARYGWRLALLGTAVVGLSWIPLWLYATRLPAARKILAPRVGEVQRSGPPAAKIPDLTRSKIALLLSPPVLRAVLVVLASSPVMAFVFLWSAKVMVAQHGLSQRDVGHYLWLPPLAFDAGAVGFGALASLRHRRLHRDGGVSSPRLIFCGALLLALSIVLLPIAHGPWFATAILSLALAGGGGLFSLLTADMMLRVDPARTAAAGGITAASQSLAYIAANYVIGQIADRTHSYDGASLCLALFVVPGCLVWLAWEPGQARPTPNLDQSA